MYVDRFLCEQRDFFCEGKSLRGAVVFRIPTPPVSSREMEEALSPFYKHIDRVQEDLSIAESGFGKRVRMLQQHELGSTSFDAAELPYDNIIFEVESGGAADICVWVVMLGVHETRGNHLALVNLRNPSVGWDLSHKNVCARMDFYQDRETRRVDWGETYVKSLDGGFVYHQIADKIYYLYLLHTALKICSIVNCANIVTYKHNPPLKSQKARVKHGKPPLFSYYTLSIKPTGRGQGSIPKQLWENRIHLCRGHFKSYTKENPLFGKYTGRYWWQPSVRGKNKGGVIIKDYRVERMERYA